MLGGLVIKWSEGIVKEYVNYTFIGVKNIGGFHIPPSSNASSLYTQVTPL